ncbi:glycoside hydrolase superfamily, partial [Dendryphion nanum]
MRFLRFASWCLAALWGAQDVVADIAYAGVNSAGGEFGQTILPGAFGVDYQFINETSIDFFLDAGVNTIRIPFLLERMCPIVTGLGNSFNETYFEEFQAAINYITMRGAYAVLDVHNYGRYNDPSSQPQSGSVIGDHTDPTAATTEQFAAFWAELATRFISNPNVIFGIMNEPHSMPTTLVLTNDQAAINAIRSAGATQLILVPGNGFAGAQRWVNETCDDDCLPNSEIFTAIRDPGNNFAFDMHLYFDNDTSGTHDECTADAPQNIVPVTDWLKENNFTAFLSEFGAGSTPTCFETLNNTLNWLEDHDQFIGWTYWSAGPLWGDYFFSIEPGTGPQAESTWPEVLEPHVKSYQPMQRCGVSSSKGDKLGDDGRRAAEGCLGVKLPA